MSITLDKATDVPLRQHAEFIPQQLAGLFILTQGGGLLAGLCVELHESAVGVFVERVERQPAASNGYRGLMVMRGGMRPGTLFQYHTQVPVQALSLEGLPVIKLRAIGQTEAGQEIGGIKVGGGTQSWKRSGRRGGTGGYK